VSSRVGGRDAADPAGQDQQQDEIERGGLADCALARHPEDDQQEAVDRDGSAANSGRSRSLRRTWRRSALGLVGPTMLLGSAAGKEALGKVAIPTSRKPRMSYVQQLLDTYPRSFNVDKDLLAACIEACVDCAQACTACGDACLSEEAVDQMAKCIRLDADCADVCAATGRVLSRQTEYDANVTRTVLTACRTVCASCADECERHSHEHCRVCAEACRRCEEACDQLLNAISP
jgi:hypothetical protein